ncbi:hypothetical protein [Olivibacter sitiensis]|uniref:hypothetical protein n=1 Tax=Olivibacter sitiensis TaxID=376470 RepID=UPI0012FCF400|nr:hypothetical protein [Olivibacter sitiensis]
MKNSLISKSLVVLVWMTVSFAACKKSSEEETGTISLVGTSWTRTINTTDYERYRFVDNNNVVIEMVLSNIPIDFEATYRVEGATVYISGTIAGIPSNLTGTISGNRLTLSDGGQATGVFIKD